jgi:hypothetical protein
MPMNKQPKEQMFLVSSGYGGNTKRPFVQLQHPSIDRPLTISPNEARALALNLMECADAAETDGFLVEFFKGDMEQPDQTVAYLMIVSLIAWLRRWWTGAVVCDGGLDRDWEEEDQ